MTNYTRKTVKGAGLVFSASALAAVIAYSTRIVLARNLEPAEYGLFYAVFTVISFCLFFRDLGFPQAVVKFIAQYKLEDKFREIKSVLVSTFLVQITSSTIMAIVLFLLADFLALHYFRNPQAAIVLKILLIYLFGSVIFRLLRSTFNGFQNVKIYALLEPLRNLVALLLISTFIFFDFGVFAPTIAYSMVGFVCGIILLFPLLKMYKFYKYRTANFKEVLGKLITFGIPVFATSIAAKFISDIDTMMLTYFRPLAEVGIYNVILPSALLFMYVSTSISVVIFPMVVELWIKKDKRRLSEGVRLMLKYLFFIIIPPALIIFSNAKFIISLLFGEAYQSGGPALQILMVGFLLYIVVGLNHSIISAIGRPKTVAKIVIAAAFFNIITNLILIPKFGIIGAAFSTSFSYFLMLVLSTNRVTHYISVKFPKRIWLQLTFAGLSFIGVVTLVKMILHINAWIEIFLSVTIGLIVYLLLAWNLKVVNMAEVRRYYAIFRKLPQKTD